MTFSVDLFLNLCYCGAFDLYLTSRLFPPTFIFDHTSFIFAIVPYKNSKTSLLLSVHHNALKSYTDRRNVHNLCNVVRGDGEQLWGRVNN